MKKIAMFSVLAMLLVGAVQAVSMDKNVIVTGDWAWDGDSWVNGNFPTATYSMELSSPTTEFMYFEDEKLGTAWKYDLSSQLQTGAKTNINTLLTAWTVNDPETTPATGGYTKYKYMQTTMGEYSTSSFSVKGQGTAVVGSSISITSGAMQFTDIDIN